jgi:hypothetical protein
MFLLKLGDLSSASRSREEVGSVVCPPKPPTVGTMDLEKVRSDQFMII